MNELDAHLSDFTADWLQREPALALCQRFALKPAHWLAAVVLVEELLQAMFGLSKLELAQAKLAWWADEAQLAVANTPRHPLTLAMCAAQQDLIALPSLTQAALDWIEMSAAADANAQRQQFAAFASAASDLVNEGDCTAIWIELALKRQLESYAKPDRYGPSVLNRAALAEFQLKATQINDAAGIAHEKIGQALSAKLSEMHQTLCDVLPSQAYGRQSATRAYGLLHAREAKHWAKVILAKPGGFTSIPPGFAGLLQAWWIARA